MSSNDTKGIFRENLYRSLLKAFSYRVIIVVADFLAVCLFTQRTDVALGFVLISSIYTTVLYIVQERFWDRVNWGKVRA
jgi:uncharacterized membrane protein